MKDGRKFYIEFGCMDEKRVERGRKKGEGEDERRREKKE